MYARGTRRSDRLTGAEERDHLIGDWGNDTLFGLDGDDLLMGDLNDDTRVRAGGNDRLFGGNGNDVLVGGRGNDRLVGGEGNDVLAGGYANGFFTDSVSSGHGISYGLAIPAGDDDYDGGVGNDTAYLLYRSERAGISLDISNTRRVATIQRDGVDAGSIVGVETLVFQGGDGDDHVIAARIGAPYASDRLEGGAGDDILDGGGGIDLLIGGAGNDTLIGGGEDIASYQDIGFDGRPGVTVDLRLNKVAQDTGGGGIDTLVGIRSLIGSTGSDRLTGNGAGNDLSDFQSGDDSLFGLAGDDDLKVERFLLPVATTVTLDGGTGNDRLRFYSNNWAVHDVTMVGGDGDDTIEADGGNTVIDAGAGDDRVVLDANIGTHRVTLGAGVDTVAPTIRTGRALEDHGIRIVDFAAGAGGDRIDMMTLLGQATGYRPQNDPFDAYLRLEQQGDDVVLLGDRDGTRVANGFETLVVIENVQLDQLTGANFILPASATGAVVAFPPFASDIP